MLVTLLALQIVLLVLFVAVLLRSAAPQPWAEALRAADLPAHMVRAEARADTIERLLRAELASLRQDTADASQRLQEGSSRSAEALRAEMLQQLSLLNETLRAGLDGFRNEHRNDAERLRGAVDTQMTAMGRRLGDSAGEAARQQIEGREALHHLLSEMARTQAEHQERLRGTVEQRLDKLNEANAAKLEEMRSTVDEKLHATLQTRLTESFGAVTDQLTKVHTGLGEMSKLSAGVDDLSRIFTNVKSRGGFAEVQLGMLLGQMLAPNQFSQNVKVKPNTGEMVEYAVKLPTPNGEVLLPIDAKFPREAWERLETAYAEAPEDIASAGRAFEAAIRTEGRRICEKYISPPTTTTFAVMFLPTEGLYAEVMRRDGLQADIQQSCRVTIAGPSTLSALLNSFQMGFHMLDLKQKGDEVWKVLASARVQFGKFEDLMTKMDDQVSKVQKTIQEVGTRTRVINRTLRDVSVETAEPQSITSGKTKPKAGHEGLLPMLVANED